MTLRRVELRCRWRLHGVLVLDDEYPYPAIERTIEFECPRCSKRQGQLITHAWNVVTGAKLPDKGEKFAQAA